MNTAGLLHRAGSRTAPAAAPRRVLQGRSAVIGAAGAAAMMAFYVTVVAWASGSWDHLGDQARADVGYLVLIVAGFGTQVALLAELRHRRTLDRHVAATGGAGAGASGVGMVACCAHHLADLLPIVGATGAATFLTDQRVLVMLLGITVNLVGVTLAARRLRLVAAHRARTAA